MSLYGYRNANWRGGRSIASNGYVLLRVGRNHHLSDVRGYAYEHRVVAEKILGRRLRGSEIPHHKNGIRTDNRPSNIEVMPSRAHHALKHRRRQDLRVPGEPNQWVACACRCGRHFRKFDADGRPRRYLPGHNMVHDPKTGRIATRR